MYWYLFICLLFFGIGDFLGVVTKAKVSAVFVSLMLFLIAFMAGWIPPDVIMSFSTLSLLFRSGIS